jgi:PRC-barrel domain
VSQNDAAPTAVALPVAKGARCRVSSRHVLAMARGAQCAVGIGTSRSLPAFSHSYSDFRGDPMRKILLGGLLATTMLIPAFAAGDMWRSSKLVGLNVYNDQNEKLGDISEILLDKSGKVDGVIIGVGGFLGMGQHEHQS